MKFDRANKLFKSLMGNEIMSKRGIEAYKNAEEFINLFEQTGLRIYLGNALLVLTKFLKIANEDEDSEFKIQEFKTTIYRAIIQKRTENKEEEIQLFEYLVQNYRKIINDSPEYVYIDEERIFDTGDRYHFAIFLLFLCDLKADNTLEDEALNIVERLCYEEPSNYSFSNLKDTIISISANKKI